MESRIAAVRFSNKCQTVKVVLLEHRFGRCEDTNIPSQQVQYILTMRRKHWLHFLTLSGIMLTAIACSDKQDSYRDIRNYYFPLKRLKDGLVYEYRSVNNPQMAPVYWYFRSVVQDGKKVLTSTYYEQDLLPLQHLQEEMVSNGMLLEKMYIYGPAGQGGGRQQRTSAEIIAGNVFPFYVRDSGGIFLYNVTWKDPTDSLILHTVVRNRYFAGDTSIELQGRKHRAVKFALKENYEMDNYGVFETLYTGEEVYVKGIGLAYYKKNISPELTLEFRLVDRYPMEILEERFRQWYGK